MGVLADDCCFTCGAGKADMSHCLWWCSVIQAFWKRVVNFSTTHLTNFVPFNALWAIFGYLDQVNFLCTPGCRKLLYMISAAGLKTILHTWNHSSLPPFKLFLEVLWIGWRRLKIRNQMYKDSLRIGKALLLFYHHMFNGLSKNAFNSPLGFKRKY